MSDFSFSRDWILERMDAKSMVDDCSCWAGGAASVVVVACWVAADAAVVSDMFSWMKIKPLHSRIYA